MFEPKIEKKVKLENHEFLISNFNKELSQNPIKLIQSSIPNQFGNYHNYYQIRNKQQLEDFRIQQFDHDHFYDKKVLDVGCNDGTLSIQIGIKFFPKQLTAIDIDYKLINKAIENIKFYEKQQKSCKPDILQNYQSQISQLPKCFQAKFNRNKILSKSNVFPYNMQFKIENYIQNTSNEQFDTILCLSVTKWIHLNFGDQGIHALFDNFERQLKTNGILILEVQEWKSYKKRRLLTADIFNNYKNLKIKPHDFQQLLEARNFKFIQQTNNQNGFLRKIQYYQKI